MSGSLEFGACNEISQRDESEQLCFVDSDQVILNQPDFLELSAGTDAAFRPVDTATSIGAADSTSRNWPFWVAMFESLGVTELPYVETTVDRKRILAYYNTGFVIARREKRLFEAWHDNFLNLMEKEIHPADGIKFIEQAAMGAAAHGLRLNIEILPTEYNYPLPWHEKIPVDGQAMRLNELVVGHYHRMFNAPARQHPLESLFGDDEQSCWLRSQLAELEMYPHRFAYRLQFTKAQVLKRMKQKLGMLLEQDSRHVEKVGRGSGDTKGDPIV